MVLKRPKSLRQPSNKKTGGQVGHQGSTLKMVKDPDLVVTHHPKTCQAVWVLFRKTLNPQKTIRRQVFDLPSLRLQVTRSINPKLKYVLTVTLKMKDYFRNMSHNRHNMGHI